MIMRRGGGAGKHKGTKAKKSGLYPNADKKGIAVGKSRAQSGYGSKGSKAEARGQKALSKATKRTPARKKAARETLGRKEKKLSIGSIKSTQGAVNYLKSKGYTVTKRKSR